LLKISADLFLFLFGAFGAKGGCYAYSGHVSDIVIQFPVFGAIPESSLIFLQTQQTSNMFSCSLSFYPAGRVIVKTAPPSEEFSAAMDPL
jgi:hypothetical protein